jgi:hypothetical protein
MFMQALEIVTIGLPFCAFKIVTGLFFHQYWLVALGILDLIINLANLQSTIFLKRRIFDACFLSFAVRFIKKPGSGMISKWQDLGNSIDVLLSFTLVAIVIGGGFIKMLPADHLLIWNISVILNVFGAGSSRITTSIKNLKA